MRAINTYDGIYNDSVYRNLMRAFFYCSCVDIVCARRARLKSCDLLLDSGKWLMTAVLASTLIIQLSGKCMLYIGFA